MIKTFAILTVAAAIAGPAAATEIRLSFLGKDDATLQAEIKQAATTVCLDDSRDFAGLYLTRRCVADTIKATQAKIAEAKSAMTATPERLAAR